MCDDDERLMVKLTPYGVDVMERLDVIADKWGLDATDLWINPFMLAAARDEARSEGITIFGSDEEEGHDLEEKT